MELVKYEAACRAVAEARSIDEVKEITNRAEAARAYAKQAKNRSMEIDAIEIRTRAERRLGEIILDLRKQGHCKQGVRTVSNPIRLGELGIDSNISGPAQRLALIPHSKFESEITTWRASAETSSRFEVPLQSYRIPSIKGDRQRAAARKGRSKIDGTDPFAKFIAPDGRRVADWRFGELDRIENIFRRAADCALALIEKLPAANPDPLATMEMIFKENELMPILAEIWDTPIPMARGLQSDSVKESRTRRSRVCEYCQTPFLMDSRGNTAGRFCSRACGYASRNQGK